MRRFNTSGPVVAEDHYCIPPLARSDLAQLRELIDRKQYFVLHAPRQTGKTSALLALKDRLNAEGGIRCVYVNVEGAQTAREDVEAAIRTVLNELSRRAQDTLGDDYLEDVWPAVLAKAGGHSALRDALGRWARAAPDPLVLLIDEIDALVGDSLLAVLRQLRAGYDLRPEGFPQSVVLCGVRDVRDYRIHSASADTMVADGSAFNIKAESLRLGDFSREEVHDLLRQHTEETGQPFADTALDAVWTQTQGQPWLVNALAHETCFRGDLAADRTRPVTEADVTNAREALILRRDTHLDQLTDKLQERRVWRVVEPLLATASESSYTARDVEYVRDLGLIARDPPIRIANPIYAEVVPRELTRLAQDDLPHDPASYVDQWPKKTEVGTGPSEEWTPAQIQEVKLSDKQWQRVCHHFRKETNPKGHRGRPPAPTRRIFEAVLWILRTDSHWSFLPQCYPNYETVRRRFQAWERTGVIERALRDLASEAEQGSLFDGATLYDALLARAEADGSSLMRLPASGICISRRGSRRGL